VEQKRFAAWRKYLLPSPPDLFGRVLQGAGFARAARPQRLTPDCPVGRVQSRHSWSTFAEGDAEPVCQSYARDVDVTQLCLELAGTTVTC